MAGQSGAGTGTGTTHTPITDLQAKIRGGTNPQARMTTAFNTLLGQCRAATKEGLPAVQTWLANYNGDAIKRTVETIMEGSTEG